MRPSSAARMPSLIGFVAALSLAFAVLCKSLSPQPVAPTTRDRCVSVDWCSGWSRLGSCWLRANPTKNPQNRRL